MKAENKMSRLFDKKKKDAQGEMSDVEKSAKSSVLEDLRDQASKAMSGKLHGLKKVTVASDSGSGLEHGLDKAKEMLGGMHGEGYHDKNDMLQDTEDGDGDGLHDASKMHDAENEERQDENEPGSGQQHGDSNPDAHMIHDDMDKYATLAPHEVDAKLKHLMHLKSKMGRK